MSIAHGFIPKPFGGSWVPKGLGCGLWLDDTSPWNILERRFLLLGRWTSEGHPFSEETQAAFAVSLGYGALGCGAVAQWLGKENQWGNGCWVHSFGRRGRLDVQEEVTVKVYGSLTNLMHAMSLHWAVTTVRVVLQLPEPMRWVCPQS